MCVPIFKPGKFGNLQECESYRPYIISCARACPHIPRATGGYDSEAKLRHELLTEFNIVPVMRATIEIVLESTHGVQCPPPQLAPC